MWSKDFQKGNRIMISKIFLIMDYSMRATTMKIRKIYILNPGDPN